jgi:hypothetical protein
VVTTTKSTPSNICKPTIAGMAMRWSAKPSQSATAKKGTNRKEKPNGRMTEASTTSSPRTKARARSMNSTESAIW